MTEYRVVVTMYGVEMIFHKDGVNVCRTIYSVLCILYSVQSRRYVVQAREEREGSVRYECYEGCL